jgi:hypothetical protein
MKEIIAGPDADPMILARGTPGFSGADLQNMVKYVFLCHRHLLFNLVLTAKVDAFIVKLPFRLQKRGARQLN